MRETRSPGCNNLIQRDESKKCFDTDRAGALDRLPSTRVFEIAVLAGDKIEFKLE